MPSLELDAYLQLPSISASAKTSAEGEISMTQQSSISKAQTPVYLAPEKSAQSMRTTAETGSWRGTFTACLSSRSQALGPQPPRLFPAVRFADAGIHPVQASGRWPTRMWSGLCGPASTSSGSSPMAGPAHCAPSTPQRPWVHACLCPC